MLKKICFPKLSKGSFRVILSVRAVWQSEPVRSLFDRTLKPVLYQVASTPNLGAMHPTTVLSTPHIRVAFVARSPLCCASASNYV